MYSSKLDKNFIYEIGNDYQDNSKDLDHFYKKNKCLNKQLNKQKNKIDFYYNENSGLWDNMKKFSNEYEFIYTNNSDNFKNVSNIFPISRSYFKLWEILHDFNFNNNNTIFNDLITGEEFTTCHLAEGPGGFIECIYKFILKYITNDFSKIKIYGSTLFSNNNTVPRWKIKKNILNKYNIILNNNINENGDLYCIKQVELLINKIGKNKCNFITADGGFDFSSNYNGQEKNFLNLFISEIYIILNLLKNNGNGLIKIYDIFSKNSIKVLYILSIFFEKIYIIKPFTSRPANSEKYILCKKFNINEKNSFYLEILKNIIITKNLELLNNKNINTPYNFIHKIYNYNKWYTQRQISYINKTINYINIFIDDENNKKNNIVNGEKNKIVNGEKSNIVNSHINFFFNNLYNLNKKSCIEWCKNYKII
tara:strand:+ start:1111 stop:2379 length:1269 start_codon:yes stop_codon:yes gene_type:complete